VLITRDQSARFAVERIKPDAYGVGLDMFQVCDRALSLDLSPVACAGPKCLIRNLQGIYRATDSVHGQSSDYAASCRQFGALQRNL
jgi:hypothetical protein